MMLWREKVHYRRIPQEIAKEIPLCQQLFSDPTEKTLSSDFFADKKQWKCKNLAKSFIVTK